MGLITLGGIGLIGSLGCAYPGDRTLELRAVTPDGAIVILLRTGLLRDGFGVPRVRAVRVTMGSPENEMDDPRKEA
jgi:hypothetical protein